MSETSVHDPTKAFRAVIAAAQAQNDQPSTKLKYSTSDTKMLAGTDNPHIMDTLNITLWLAFRAKLHNGLREVSRNGISLWQGDVETRCPRTRLFSGAVRPRPHENFRQRFAIEI